MGAHASNVDSTVESEVADPEVTDAASFGKKVLRESKAEDLPMLAASIAYQAFVSLVPLLALLFIAARVIGDQALAQQVLGYTQSFLPGPAQTMLRDYILGQASIGLTGAGLIGFVTLVWGAFKIFRGLDKAFSDIYDTERSNSFTDQFKDSAIVLGSLAVAVIAAVVTTTVFAVAQIPFVGVLSPLILAVGLGIAFLPIYYEFPDLDLSWKEVLPGVAFAAIGWTLLQILFQMYLSLTGKASPASIIGAVLVLLTWLYFGGMVLLGGAVINAVVIGKRATGETYDPSASESDAEQSPEQTADASAAARELERERDRLEYARRRLEYEREALERAHRRQDVDVDELLRQNRDLARRIRWYEKPLWTRLLLRVLGRKPTR